MNIRATESEARKVIDGQMDEILGYINPANDGHLAAWMMAKERAMRMVYSIQTVCNSIAARPMLGPGQMALRAIATEQFTEEDFGTTPEQEAAFEALARETAQIHEAQRIESSHPEVFDMPNFAARVCGFKH